MTSTTVCWFRTDLRVRDNLALQAAMACGPVIGLYIATPGQWQRHDDADIKLDFWRRNLEALKQELKSLGIPLVICQVPDYAAIPDLFREIADRWQLSSLCFNREYPLNESRRDASVTVLCDELGVSVRAFDDSVLMPPGSILNNSEKPFRVFTPFSRKARQMLGPTSMLAPEQATPLEKTRALPTLKSQRELDEIVWPEINSHWPTRWPAGEEAALDALEGFTRTRIASYKNARDFPAINGTSTIGPWLNAGVISIRQCWRQSGAWQDGEGVETWKNELLWREFYKHIMFHFPRASMGLPFKEDMEHIPWRRNEEEYTRWCNGETGIPIVDAAMRQLLETGWMHNRLRMITAMFLSKHLLIDWREGERWFMRHLLDGDFSANNGGWQWSASTGTDAVPYFRVFNPVTQSRRFDEDGEFIRRYVPELADISDKKIHDPGLFRAEGYPAPLIDLKFGRERALSAFRKPD